MWHFGHIYCFIQLDGRIIIMEVYSALFQCAVSQCHLILDTWVNVLDFFFPLHFPDIFSCTRHDNFSPIVGGIFFWQIFWATIYEILSSFFFFFYMQCSSVLSSYLCAANITSLSFALELSDRKIKIYYAYLRLILRDTTNQGKIGKKWTSQFRHLV